MQGWISHPDAVDAHVADWASRYPGLLQAESIPQFAGRPVWALTVTDRSVDDAGKKKIMVYKPHAHEPAPIAGQMSAIQMLLTGESFDGRPSLFDNARVLRDCLITFMPDANPEGTAHAPVEYWDGSAYTNEEFWAWMRGLDPDTGKMWKRVDLWDDTLEEKLPTRYGIVYEQISAHEYVEPNRHHRSSLFQWIFRLMERSRWDFLLDLHQTEFERQEENCMVILPCLFDQQPPAIQQTERAWAEAILDAWQAMPGVKPIRPAEPLNYTGQQRQYFVERWGSLYSQAPILTSEIQNNNPRTPPHLQMRLNEAAIVATVEVALAGL